MAIRAEEFLKKHLVDNDEEVSTMTVPLRIDSVYHVSGPAVLANEDSLLGDRTEIPAHTRRRFEKRSSTDAVDALREFGLTPDDDEEFYSLDGDELYGVTYSDTISIPRGHVGIVFPNSKLVKAGGTLFTSIHTADDDELPLEGTLRTDNDLLLKKDLQVGSLLVFESDSISTARMANLIKSISQTATQTTSSDSKPTSGKEESELSSDESDADTETDTSVEGALPESDAESDADDAASNSDTT